MNSNGEPAYEISFISKLEQKNLHEVLKNPNYRLNAEKAKIMREKSKARLGILTCADIEAIFKVEGKNKNAKVPPYKIKPEFMAKYYPNGYFDEEIETEMAAALKFYRANKNPEN